MLTHGGSGLNRDREGVDGTEPGHLARLPMFASLRD
jgi:hypothetical protein